MARLRSTRPTRPRRRGPLAWCARRLGALAVALMLGVIIGGGLLYSRLQQGPVSLGPLAQTIVDQLNSGEASGRYRIGDAVIALSTQGGSSGLRLRDVQVFDAAGEQVVQAPELGVSFRLIDVLSGRAAPQMISLTGVEARLIRTEDGVFSFDFGPREATQGPGAQGLADLLDSSDPNRPLSQLERIEARDIALTYDDRAAGQVTRVSGVSLDLWRTGQMLNGRLIMRDGPGAGPGLSLQATGRRQIGAGFTDVTLQFSNAYPSDLAMQIPALGALDGLPGALSGMLQVAFADTGALLSLEGALSANGLVLPLGGAETPVDDASVKFAFDPGADRFDIADLSLASPLGATRLTGEVSLRRHEGAVAGVEADLTVDHLHISAADLFETPVRFDGGRVAVSVDLDPAQAVINDVTLTDGATRITLGGALRREGDGVAGGLTMTALGVPVSALRRYWPVSAAKGAREWTVRNILTGHIPTLDLALALSPGETDVALDFGFEGVEARVVKGLPHILNGVGRGGINEGAFTLNLASGVVEMADAEPIVLDGSVFEIPDILAKPARATPRLTGRGRVADILRLIDHDPLKLTSKLNVDLGDIGGTAVVDAGLDFPLLKRLKTSEIGVEAQAELSDVTLTAPFRDLPVAAEALTLTADTQRLRVRGPARIDGTAARIDWRQRLSRKAGGPATRLSVGVRADEDVLRAFGVTGLKVTRGAIPVEAEVTVDGGPARIGLTADLGPAGLSIPMIGWSKPRGEAGSFSATLKTGEDLRLDKLALTAPGLTVEGDVRLASDGALKRADIRRFRLGRGTDVSVAATQSNGALEVEIAGRSLDISRFRSAASSSGGGGEALRARIAVEGLRLTETLTIRGATGAVYRGDGGLSANIAGRINGGVAAEARYNSSGGAGRLTLTTSDAGRALRDMGYFSSGHGGELTLGVTLADGRYDGDLDIRGLVVRDAPTLAKILSYSSLIGILDEMGSGGITFTAIEAPFRMEGGRIRIDEATAIGPAIGLKVSGDYDGSNQQLALDGVLTPAYALNGVLGQLPVLGEVLGGKGEGLIAITFDVDGPVSDPRISVNPLSVLTPGAFRRLFQGGSGVARAAGPSGQDQDLADK